MYKSKNKVYSDAGKYLKCGNRVAYEFDETATDVAEIVDNVDGFVKVGGMVTWSDGVRAIKVVENGTYDDYKTRMVKARYSYDDQIAIMLNKDSGEEEDALAYERMQEWRDYAGKVAKKIMEVV